MHIEKNMFENIFNTVVDVKGKTKDNIKARLDESRVWFMMSHESQNQEQASC
jgi:hypothetical protein